MIIYIYRKARYVCSDEANNTHFIITTMLYYKVLNIQTDNLFA